MNYFYLIALQITNNKHVKAVLKI